MQIITGLKMLLKQKQARTMLQIHKEVINLIFESHNEL